MMLDPEETPEDMIANLSNRVASLESDIEQLRELLKAVVENNSGDTTQIENWEIARSLSTWANGGD